MSAHKYELMFIADPELDERGLKKLTEQYLEIVTNEGGSVENIDIWGRRKLAYEIAGKMSWSIRCRDWADFPLAQKFFAVGEALAHLDHLEAQGRVRRQEIHGKRVYFAGVGDKI